MSSGIYTAMAGAVAQTQALDTVSNNIANVSTTGFRAERIRFGEALTRAKGKSIAYVQAKGGATDTRPGLRTETGNALDVAISGDGYFAVQTPRGERVTRAGDFQLDEGGQLVTSDGYPVLSADAKPIIVGKDGKDMKDISIRADGTVSAGSRTIGTIDVRNYNATDLTREGNSLYIPNAKPIAGARSELAIGELEQGNFNVVTGMVDLIRISRNYESLHRMLETYREMDDRIAKLNP